MLSSRSTRWFLASVCSSLIAAGCATATDTPSGETGAVSLNLELAPGVEINEVDWVLTSPGMDPMSGTINTSAPGATASVEVFGLPPGDDYNVALMATSEDGSVTCGGDADFEVEVGETTPIMVMLNCKRPERLGGVRVNGKFNICADLAKVIVSPLQTSVGNDIDLFAAAVDAEGDTIKYVWSGMGGIIDDPNDPTTTYTCGTVGIHEITIAVTDDDMEYCVDSWTVPVACVEGDEDLCEDVDCDDRNQCTANRCNPASGECITADVDDGTKCDLLGLGDGVCEAGECVEVDLCEGKDCNDDNECTLDLCDDETGNCANPPVDDGTDCNGGEGMCFEGNCRDIDRCENVICEPTLNDCTVGICNMDTGECDIVDRPDGTECNGGAGSCSAGECIDDNLCDEVVCPSTDCTEAGMCDPATGECGPGTDVPAGEPCDLIGVGDGLCDGSGSCVECNEALDCGPAPQCFIPTCVDNTCGEQTVPDGTECDLIGIGDGVCDSGECVEPPECTIASQCPDMVCTSKDCNMGVCEYAPTDGASCEVEPGLPGTCDQNVCVGLCEGETCPSLDECVQDGSCDDQSGECIPGDNEPNGTPCEDGTGECLSGTCIVDKCKDIICEPTLNDCTVGICDMDTGECEETNVPDDTPCSGGEGTCQSGTCELGTVQAEEFLAVDCALLGNSASIPIDSQVTPGAPAVEGVPLDVTPQETIVLPADLVCGFLTAGFVSAEVANSNLSITMTNATPGSVALTDFLDDGSDSPNLVSPHAQTLFDFATACGCANPPPGDLVPPCGTGPGIVVPFLANAPGTIPPGTDPVTITPGSGSTVDFLVTYDGLALELRNLKTAFTIPAVCLGGACPANEACAPENRDTIPGSDSPDDSPRIMYDASCNKAQADAGTCVPFDDFAGVADVCVGRTPTSPVDPDICTDSATCCAALETLFPTATPAQQPQLNVSPAP